MARSVALAELQVKQLLSPSWVISSRDPLARGLALVALGLGAGMTACRPPVESGPAREPQAISASAKGTLELWANGEAFVREGLVSKDGWALQFERVYVTLADITAYQTDPPFEGKGELQAKALVNLTGPLTVDLVPAAGAERVLLGSLEAPPGHYNALAWRLVPAAEGPAKGYSLWIEGTARPAKGEGEGIPFVLKFSPELAFVCGEYVGEARKGFVQAGQVADLEVTFHFDHLFGDGSLPPEDDLNRAALGFAPLVKLDPLSLEQRLKGGSDPLVWDDLQESGTASETLLEILQNLGHVGEGHCRASSDRLGGTGS
ncbi:hypothetical protein NW851_07620 [Synechococcus sp. H55.7]|uniref:hypothetical protein n=1 Tax=unclassified Synechococcus TaxID=2626047 RepID=UPI0039C438A2